MTTAVRSVAIVLVVLGCSSPPPDVSPPTCHGLALTASSSVRLIAPLSTTRVTARRPTFRWASAAGAEATLEVCTDRSCANVVATTRSTMQQAMPDAELPPGVLFWRVTVGADASAVWQVRVPARGSATDTAWGSTLDVDADGYADIAAIVSQHLVLYGGAAAGIDMHTSTSIGPRSSPAEPGEEDVSWGAGGFVDVNGDGYSDIIAGNDTTPARVFYGGPTAPSFDRSSGLGPRERYVGSIVGLDDVDRDGYGDALVISGTTYPRYDHASFFRGGPSGLPCAASTTLDAADGESWISAAPAGDVDADGFADVLLTVGVSTTSATSVTPTSIVLLRGSADGLDVAPSATLEIAARGVRVGDFDGDGHADVVAMDDAHAYIHPGSATGLSTSPSVTIDGAVAVAVDLDHDGFDDLIVSDATGTRFHSGSAAGLDPSRFVAFTATTDLPSLAGAIAIGDVNGDLNADLALAGFLPGMFPSVPEVLVLLGTGASVAVPPAAVLIDPFALDRFGSSFVLVTN